MCVLSLLLSLVFWEVPTRSVLWDDEHSSTQYHNTNVYRPW